MSTSGGLGRSVGAVVGGIMVGFVLTVITDVVLHAVGVFPPWGSRWAMGRWCWLRCMGLSLAL